MRRAALARLAVVAVVGIPALGATACSDEGVAADGPATGADEPPPARGDIRLKVEPIPAIDGRYFTSCLVFRDLDGDSRPDLFTVGASDGIETVDAGVALRNTGSGFEEVAVPFHPVTFTTGCAAADYDGDGLTDIYIAAFRASVLLRNLGGMRFEDVTEVAGLAPAADHQYGVSPGFLDYDRDGWLDLYLGMLPFVPNSHATFSCDQTSTDFQCRYDDPDDGPDAQSILYRNLGGQGFERVAGAAGAPNLGAANATAVIDWDQDGWPDLATANDFGEARIYINQQGQRFVDAAPLIGVDRYSHGMGLAFGDLDANGVWDMYLADLGPDQLWYGRDAGAAADERAWEMGIGPATQYHSNWAPLVADLDSDGWADLLVASSGAVRNDEDLDLMAHNFVVPDEPDVQHDLVFANRGLDADGVPRSFDTIRLEHPRPTDPAPTTGATAVADFDLDGDLDVAVASGKWPFVDLRLYRNDSPGGAALAVALEGPPSNRHGIGARVVVETGAHTQTRYVSAQSGSVGVSTSLVYFGLGTADAVDRLTVRWPDGETSTFDGPIAPDQLLTVAHP